MDSNRERGIKKLQELGVSNDGIGGARLIAIIIEDESEILKGMKVVPETHRPKIRIKRRRQELFLCK